MSSNMAPMTLEEAARLAEGELIHGDPGCMVRGVTTDSRTVPPRSLFVALRGERFDAHAFVAAAAGAGAVAAIVDRPIPAPVSFGLILVKDTTRALGTFAANYRRKFRVRVTAITGTSGKTTTKDLLGAICRRRHRTLVTQGNLNNHIGVPLTLVGLGPKTEKAVIEMGMSDLGEIAYLASLAAPQCGIITSIGPAHLDRLGNVEGVLNAKAELIEYLNAHSGTVILDRDGDHFEKLAERVTCRLISVGETPGADIEIRGVEAAGFDPASFVYQGIRIRLRQAGRHVVANAALAAAAAEVMGVDRLDVIFGLEEAFPAPGRTTRMELDGAVIIDDAYNANPLSFRSALEMLAASRANRKIVVMGDMLELGQEAERYHEELGREIERRKVDVLLYRGKLAAIAAGAARKLRTVGCGDNTEMIERLNEILLPGDVVLVKASHGMRLDEVVGGIVARRRKGVSLVALKR